MEQTALILPLKCLQNENRWPCMETAKREYAGLQIKSVLGEITHLVTLLLWPKEDQQQMKSSNEPNRNCKNSLATEYGHPPARHWYLQMTQPQTPWASCLMIINGNTLCFIQQIKKMPSLNQAYTGLEVTVKKYLASLTWSEQVVT